MYCCLKECGNKIISQNDSRVEVKTVLPSRFSGENFRVYWNKNGEAKFHLPCWQRLFKSKTTAIQKTRTKRSRSESSDFLTKQERALIREAKKTAEFFDSADHIVREAQRVADMIKSSKHCIVFTGW